MILAVDIGTSSCKGCGFDEETLLPITKWERRAYAELTSPQAWFDACLAVLESIVADAKPDKPATIVVLSGMMQNVILPNDNTCILYNDATFALKAHDHLSRKRHPAKLKKLTGNYKDSASVVAKLHQLQHKRKLQATQPVLFGAHSYVAWRMLNIKDEGLLCDPTTASTTGLIESATGEWISKEHAKEFGISMFTFPRLLKDASRIVGHIHLLDKDNSRLNGLPLIHGSGDLGSLVAAVERWGFTTHGYLGTSGWIAKVMPRTATPRQDVFVLAHPLDSSKAVHAMPTTCAGFNASKWSQTLFDKEPHFLDTEAEKSKPESCSVLYLPYLRGERAPVSMPEARACFLGLSSETTLQDMALAVLSGVAFQFRWLLESFNDLSSNDKTSSLCLLGGGSRSHAWRQVFADVLNVTVKSLNERQELDETVWGAACIAKHSKAKKEFLESMWIVHKPRDRAVTHYNQLFPIWQRAANDLKDLFSRTSKSKL